MHCVLPVHVVRQSPKHFTVHDAESEHVTTLRSPTSSLHVVLALQVTAAASPSLKSQLELSTHDTVLPSPPIPLQSDESLQVTESSSADVALHFALSEHASEHAPSPQSVLQSAPPTHAHAASAHWQPAPVHVGSEPPQAAPSKQITSIHARMCILLAR